MVAASGRSSSAHCQGALQRWLFDLMVKTLEALQYSSIERA